MDVWIGYLFGWWGHGCIGVACGGCYFQGVCLVKCFVIVIGGGFNGFVVAIRFVDFVTLVIVLEVREVVGGRVVGVEFALGY